MVSFKVIDEQLDNNLGNKKNYLDILQQKKKLLDAYKNKNLTATKYKTMIESIRSKTAK